MIYSRSYFFRHIEPEGKERKRKKKQLSDRMTVSVLPVGRTDGVVGRITEACF